MSKFQIRKARLADAEKIFALVSRTIDACYTGYYTEKIVGAFHNFHSAENILSAAESGKCYVCVRGSMIVGTVMAEGTEVHRLFVSPDAQGEGVGSALLHFAESQIQKTSSFVQVDSSIPAEKFYEHMGYILKEERTDEVCGELIYWKVFVKNFPQSAVIFDADSREGRAERKAEDDNFFSRVYDAVQKIPCGKVANYGQIARLCGSPRSSRAVGYALHVNPLPGIVPCHRVVNREGRLAPAFAFGGAEVQKDLLERESVEVFQRDGLYYVNMEKYRWNP